MYLKLSVVYFRFRATIRELFSIFFNSNKCSSQSNKYNQSKSNHKRI